MLRVSPLPLMKLFDNGFLFITLLDEYYRIRVAAAAAASSVARAPSTRRLQNTSL